MWCVVFVSRVCIITLDHSHHCGTMQICTARRFISLLFGPASGRLCVSVHSCKRDNDRPKGGFFNSVLCVWCVLRAYTKRATEVACSFYVSCGGLYVAEEYTGRDGARWAMCVYTTGNGALVLQTHSTQRDSGDRGNRGRSCDRHLIRCCVPSFPSGRASSAHSRLYFFRVPIGVLDNR